MPVYCPNHWTRDLVPDNIPHPFSEIAWKVLTMPDDLPEEAEYIVQSIVDALHLLEDEHIYRNNLRRTIRKSRIAKGEPVLTDDTSLETAFHTAMINMQLETDQMSYDKFKVIYDEVCRQLRPKEADDSEETEASDEGTVGVVHTKKTARNEGQGKRKKRKR